MNYYANLTATMVQVSQKRFKATAPLALPLLPSVVVGIGRIDTDGNVIRVPLSKSLAKGSFDVIRQWFFCQNLGLLSSITTELSVLEKEIS